MVPEAGEGVCSAAGWVWVQAASGSLSLALDLSGRIVLPDNALHAANCEAARLERVGGVCDRAGGYSPTRGATECTEISHQPKLIFVRDARNQCRAHLNIKL